MCLKYLVGGSVEMGWAFMKLECKLIKKSQGQGRIIGIGTALQAE